MFVVIVINPMKKIQTIVLQKGLQLSFCFLYKTRPNKFGSMTARKEHTSLNWCVDIKRPYNTIKDNKNNVMPCNTIKGHTRSQLIAQGHAMYYKAIKHKEIILALLSRSSTFIEYTFNSFFILVKAHLIKKLLNKYLIKVNKHDIWPGNFRLNLNQFSLQTFLLLL